MREEYGPEFWKGAERGKYATGSLAPDDPRLRVRLLDQDIAALFPDSQSVNEALRTLARLQGGLRVERSADAPRAKSA